MTGLLDRRTLIAAAVLPALGAARAQAPFNAIVGQGGHASVKAALDAAPDRATSPHRILVRGGVWKEKLTISKPFIHLAGEDRAGSQIVFDAAAGLPAPDGGTWGTFRSASLTIAASDCALSNLTVANSFDYPEARRRGSDNPAGNGLQAVALAVMQGADRTLIDRVDMTGWQDTLLVNAGRSLFRQCRVSGSVDYIFGAGTAFFDRCRIVTRGRGDMTGARQGYITAPSTLRTNPYGLVFDRCRLEKEGDLKAGVIALGRPWRPGTRFADGNYGNPEVVGQSVFLRCWMDDHIDRVAGWDRMAFQAKDGARVWFEPGDARFFEYRSEGPGAKFTPARRQLSDSAAAAFGQARVLGGWEPGP